MRRAGGVVLVFFFLLLAAACGGDDESEDADDTDGSASASAPSPSEDDTEDDADFGPLTELLATLPDDGDNAAFVIVNDLDAAREANGIDDLDDDASEDEVVDNLLALTIRAEGVAPLVSEFAGGATVEQGAREDEIGFHFGHVDSDVVTGLPPEQLQVVVGDVDPDTIEDAVASDPIWSDVLEEDEVDGVTVYSWLDDGETDFDRISETHPLGESARLAVLSDDRVAWARSDDVLEPLLDGEDSLAERDDLAELASVLEGADAVSAMFSAEVAEGGPPDGFAPYEAFAVGGGVNDDGEPLLHVALWHEDESDAEENVDELEDYAEAAEDSRLWPEVIPVDVEQEGRVVLGTFRVQEPSAWSRLAFIGDPLLRYETDESVG